MTNVACAGLEYASVWSQGKALIHALVITFATLRPIRPKTKAFAGVVEPRVNVVSKDGPARIGGRRRVL